jgi:hypothetical protein
MQFQARPIYQLLGQAYAAVQPRLPKIYLSLYLAALQLLLGFRTPPLIVVRSNHDTRPKSPQPCLMTRDILPHMSRCLAEYFCKFIHIRISAAALPPSFSTADSTKLGQPPCQQQMPKFRQISHWTLRASELCAAAHPSANARHDSEGRVCEARATKHSSVTILSNRSFVG